MNEIIKQIPLYRFLMLCNESKMDKSVLDCGAGGDCPVDLGENQYEQMDDFTVIHSYFEECEAEKYLEGMEILYKEDRILERIYEGEKIKQGFVDYIVRKL
ncbi:MAG: hypothetical protein ACERKZ_16580 [Lachnotalea sp.]